MTYHRKNTDGKFRSLKISLAIAFLSLSVFVLLISSCIELYFDFKSSEKAISFQQQFMAQKAADAVKNYIEKKIDILQTAVSTGNLASASPYDQKLAMNKLLGIEPAFRQLILLDKYGTETQRVSRISGYSLHHGKDKSYQDELPADPNPLNTRISSVYIDDYSFEPLIKISIPVLDVSAEFKGIFIAEVNLKFMWELVGSIKIGENGSAYVVDKKGTLIAFGDISRVLKGENLKSLSEVSEFINSSGSSHKHYNGIVKGITGENVVANYAPLVSPDWAVVAELPAAEAYRDVIDTLKRSIFFLFLCIVFAVMMSFYLSKKITRPIIDLRDATKKISRGDLETHIEIASNNETGELAKSFNQMIADLKRTTVSRDQLMEEINERKAIEAELREAKKQAESASEAKSYFLANMSHEIRTPMNAIIGFTKLMQDTNLDDIQKDYISTMHTSGNLLLNLINDILDFSKVEEKSFELESIDFDFTYLIESIFAMIRSKLIGSPVDVLYRMDEGPRFFKGDPTRIRQILINLIGNAIKFTEKGEIFTTISLDEEDHLGDGYTGLMRTLKISIRDTGIGIPKDKLETIFDSFTQADSSTTRKYGGTGLGLAITKAFINKMEGNIWVESEEGKGSNFIFTLKLIQAKPTIESDISPVRFESLKNKKIVIVDDNLHIGEIFREYCTSAKMDVQFVAGSGEEALSLLRNAETLPDLVISDMMMPGMDGYELINEIRKDEKLKELKVIAATSEAIPGQCINAEIKGFDGYLSKPVIKSEMINVIRAVFGDQREKGKSIVTRHMAEEISFKGMKGIIVEDNPINMKLTEKLLKKTGIIVEKAWNGRECITILQENRNYDFIFMDMQMPEMNGIEATEIIREKINQEIPIIALTAAVMKEDREKASKAGMTDFLEKPINVDLMKKMIQQHCN